MQFGQINPSASFACCGFISLFRGRSEASSHEIMKLTQSSEARYELIAIAFGDSSGPKGPERVRPKASRLRAWGPFRGPRP